VSSRCCSRTACKRSPVYTLTYMYKESTAVLGPLAAYVDPHSWDLCEMHADRLVVPRGWDVVRLPKDPAQERAEDLEALANVVREVGRDVPRPLAQPRSPAPMSTAPVSAAAEPVGQGVEVGRRGHLRVVRSAPATNE
jgi:hypothetical protein